MESSVIDRGRVPNKGAFNPTLFMGEKHCLVTSVTSQVWMELTQLGNTAFPIIQRQVV